MDSGKNGSMQSSSGGGGGGGEENPSNYHLISQTPPSLLSNSPSNYLDAFSQSQENPNSLLNLDLVWSRGLQLDQPNATTQVGNLTASSSQSILIGSQGQGRGRGSYPKKRTRASRRAPTTVLTTDTSNFRAMVQEFTGIPAPPFSASSSYSRRLDLFGTGAGAAMRSGLYPLRPSAQKIHQITPLGDTSTNATSNNNNLNSNTGKYQADQDMFLEIQDDQMLTFQSLLQHPPSNFPHQLKYPLADEAPGSSQFEELRMSHGNVNNVSSRGEGTVDLWICPSD